MPRPHIKARRAFTLVEMLAVIAIMGLLVSASMVAVRGISGGSNLTTSGYQIAEMFESAREQAILSRAPVAVGMLLANSPDARRAFVALQYVPPDSAASGAQGSWKQISRWESLPDGIIAGVPDANTPTNLTQAFSGTSPSLATQLPAVTYRGQSFEPGSGYACLIFLPDGSIYQASQSCLLTLVQGALNGTTVQRVNTANNFEIVINNATGRVRVLRP